MNKTRHPKPLFKFGDWVSYGIEHATARIIEDRGPLGYQGRRLYRIEILRQDSEPDQVEAFEENLMPAAPPGNGKLR